MLVDACVIGADVVLGVADVWSDDYGGRLVACCVGAGGGVSMCASVVA